MSLQQSRALSPGRALVKPAFDCAQRANGLRPHVAEGTRCDKGKAPYNTPGKNPTPMEEDCRWTDEHGGTHPVSTPETEKRKRKGDFHTCAGHKAKDPKAGAVTYSKTAAGADCLFEWTDKPGTQIACGSSFVLILHFIGLVIDICQGGVEKQGEFIANLSGTVDALCNVQFNEGITAASATPSSGKFDVNPKLRVTGKDADMPPLVK